MDGPDVEVGGCRGGSWGLAEVWGDIGVRLAMV